jgi:hypothetical protein
LRIVKDDAINCLSKKKENNFCTNQKCIIFTQLKHIGETHACEKIIAGGQFSTSLILTNLIFIKKLSLMSHRRQVVYGCLRCDIRDNFLIKNKFFKENWVTGDSKPSFVYQASCMSHNTYTGPYIYIYSDLTKMVYFQSNFELSLLTIMKTIFFLSKLKTHFSNYYYQIIKI